MARILFFCRNNGKIIEITAGGGGISAQKGWETMQTFTRTELKWIQALVKKDMDINREIFETDDTPFTFRELAWLRHANMNDIVVKLHITLNEDAKRIAIKNG